MQVVQLCKHVYEQCDLGLALYPYKVLPTRTGKAKIPGGEGLMCRLHVADSAYLLVALAPYNGAMGCVDIVCRHPGGRA